MGPKNRQGLGPTSTVAAADILELPFLGFPGLLTGQGELGSDGDEDTAMGEDGLRTLFPAR